MTYSLKTQICVFFLLLLPVFGQAATSINDIDNRTLCLTSNVKNEKICFSEGDVIKVRTKQKRFKGKINEIGDSTITLTRKGESQTININDVIEFRYFDKRNFLYCALVFTIAGLLFVGLYLFFGALFIAIFAIFILIILLFSENPTAYSIFMRKWFITFLGVLIGMSMSTLYAAIFKKNPFKRFKIGKQWKVNIK